MRRNLFSVTEQVTAEALPIEKLVDTMCNMEDLLSDVHEVLVSIHGEVASVAPAIERGVKQAQEGIAEAEDVRNDIKKLIAALGGLGDGLLNKGGP